LDKRYDEKLGNFNFDVNFRRNGPWFKMGDYYTLAEGIMISDRSLQRSEGDVSDPIKYIYF